jgi:hypothetical protein
LHRRVLGICSAAARWWCASHDLRVQRRLVVLERSRR